MKAGDWKLETGDWRLEIGDWRLEIGDWRLETGDWRLGYHCCHHVEGVVGGPIAWPVTRRLGSWWRDSRWHAAERKDDLEALSAGQRLIYL